MRRSLIFAIINILTACLSSLLIWCLTERDLIANVIVVFVITLTVIGMLAHYCSRVHIVKEELRECPK